MNTVFLIVLLIGFLDYLDNLFVFIYLLCIDTFYFLILDSHLVFLKCNGRGVLIC